jgi:hypothetical protein
MSAVLKPSQTKSVKERVSKEEWELRVDLAAAYQLAPIFKWSDLIFTHFSARLSGHDEFLIERHGRPSTQKAWPALLRLLERKGSNYRE